MRHTNIPFKKILVLGSGAIQIGQAGEFDYSGSQAIKALKEEDIETVLINPNIATIQTSGHMADTVYFLPLELEFVEKIIRKEQPDGIMLSFGGQTALNVGFQLSQKGLLEKYNMQVLGTPVKTIENTEDRDLFARQLKDIQLKTPVSQAVNSIDEAIGATEKIGYPVMCRSAYALGGLGSGVARNEAELVELSRKAFSFSDQILIEEYLEGWKELEFEVVRDRHNNCIVVCSMENIDPMGIHTGESIVVAPIQTLNADEHFKLRAISIQVVRHLGVVGECNIQFAFDPRTGDYRIIEVNARLSRSSALASKATGYPLAYIAAKLSLGYGLLEIENQITRQTSACFEPAMDYIVVKHPRWDLQKFKNVKMVLGSEMKSVGEVMSIGRQLEEGLQKSIRMLDSGLIGLVGNGIVFENLDDEMKNPTDKRLLAVAEAFDQGYTLERINELSMIDPWFLYKIKNIVEVKREIEKLPLKEISADLMRKAKEKGFSDIQIARLTGESEPSVRQYRQSLQIIPTVKQIDTLAAEYPAKTNYLYMTYNGKQDDITGDAPNQVVVLGGGPYRIGSSVEFDWCCVNATMTLRKWDYPTIMINCNPETVSTDYDICDKLYFEELTFERVMDIYEKENPHGVIISMGGQVSNNLAIPLHHAGAEILGTSPIQIDRAENRHQFSKLLDDLDIDQPEWQELTSLDDAEAFAKKAGYPVLIRPSYVLSGAAMGIALNSGELRSFLKKASDISPDHPVVISKFITGAKEIEVDAVAKKGDLYCYAISEHVENAGVHSGDATMVLPPQRTYLETLRRVKLITRRIARSLEISGPFNIQFIAKNNDIKVIECNLRASRSFPFVSKVLNINFIDMATEIIMDKPVSKIDRSAFDLEYVGVKAPQFSFTRLKGTDPVLGVEMASTGEVACLGDDFNEAFLKSLISVGFRMPEKNILISAGPISSKAALLDSMRILDQLGYHFFATPGTAAFMETHNLKTDILYWPSDKRNPNVLTYIDEGTIDLVINIPKNTEKDELDNDYLIRRKAVDSNVPLITNEQLAKRFVESISRMSTDKLSIKDWKEYS